MDSRSVDLEQDLRLASSRQKDYLDLGFAAEGQLFETDSLEDLGLRGRRLARQRYLLADFH